MDSRWTMAQFEYCLVMAPAVYGVYLGEHLMKGETMSFTYDISRDDYRQGCPIVLHGEGGDLSIALAGGDNTIQQADLYVVPSNPDTSTEELFRVADALVDFGGKNSYIGIDEKDVREVFPRGSFVKLVTFCPQSAGALLRNSVEEQMRELDLSDCGGVILHLCAPSSVSLSDIAGVTAIIREYVPEVLFIWGMTFDDRCEQIRPTALFSFPHE